MTYYIAGKMRGLLDYGRKAFNDAESRLSDLGNIVLNPAKLPVGMSDEKYMPICLAMLEAADAVYMLRGWEDSKGAQVEHSYAKLQNKLIIYEEDGWIICDQGM